MGTKKLTVYPSPRALAVLGQSAPALNQSLECWADLVSRATAGNSKALGAVEWAYLADVNNGTLHEPGIGNPGEMLAGSVEDGHTLDGLGGKWFGANPDKKVQALAQKLRGLDYVHAWAVIIAVQWFWENHSEVDLKEPWWTLTFRRNHSEKE